MSVLTEKSDHIKIDGWRGTWYVIDTKFHEGRKLFLLEHEIYGDETECLIVDENQVVVLDEVWNGFDDLDLLE